MPDLSTSSRRLFERIRSLLALDDRLLDLPTSHSFPAVILGSFTRDRNTADTCIASPQAPPLLHHQEPLSFSHSRLFLRRLSFISVPSLLPATPLLHFFSRTVDPLPPPALDLAPFPDSYFPKAEVGKSPHLEEAEYPG